MSVVAFTKVSLPHGWLGNMAPFPVTHNGLGWRTTEALFQALRFDAADPARELIREQKSPMAAKMVARKHGGRRAVAQFSEADVELMRLVLRLKVEQHPQVRSDLLATGEATIVEDVTSRPNASGLFWGAAKLPDGSWGGLNTLGELWVELRGELREAQRWDDDR